MKTVVLEEIAGDLMNIDTSHTQGLSKSLMRPVNYISLMYLTQKLKNMDPLPPSLPDIIACMLIMCTIDTISVCTKLKLMLCKHRLYEEKELARRIATNVGLYKVFPIC